MSDTLEETTSGTITRDHVVRRVEDWSSRIDQLYSTVESWLPSGWSAVRRRAVPMDEEMMRKFGVSACELPILDLLHHGMPDAYIEPRGLWIIGANGRLDLIRGQHHFIIVDHARSFGTPDWQIASLAERRQLKPFNDSELQAILQ